MKGAAESALIRKRFPTGWFLEHGNVVWALGAEFDGEPRGRVQTVRWWDEEEGAVRYSARVSDLKERPTAEQIGAFVERIRNYNNAEIAKHEQEISEWRANTLKWERRLAETQTGPLTSTKMDNSWPH